MNDVLTEIRFWEQVIGDSRRTVLCPPGVESRIKEWISARGMAHIIKVSVNTVIPPDRIFIIDDAAMEASLRQALLRGNPRA